MPISQMYKNVLSVERVNLVVWFTAGEEAFPVLSQLSEQGTQVDAYWADCAYIDESSTVETQVSTGTSALAFLIPFHADFKSRRFSVSAVCVERCVSVEEAAVAL